MPSVCKGEQWARLVALRDARLSLDADTARLAHTAQLLSNQLVLLQDEEMGLLSELATAEQVPAYSAYLPVRLSQV